MNTIEYKNIPNGQYVESVVSFIERYLPSFTLNAPIRETDSEWLLNDNLEIFFNHESKCTSDTEEEYPFFFKAEPKDRVEKGKPDLGAIISIKSQRNYTPFFVIECKRLPTPRPTEAERKEYVTGQKAGIARFKRNEHGVNLPIGAMIGYIEKDDFIDWHNQINDWILSLNGTTETNRDNNKDITWDATEILKSIYQKDIARLHSVHPRINSTLQNTVMLIHFWVKVKV
jgi:hypothetical protein